MIPDKIGHYWCRWGNSSRHVVEVTEISEGEFVYWISGSETRYSVNDETIWLGPVVDPAQDVVEFHQAMFPHLIATLPAIPANPIAKLRLKLIEEEYREMVAGLDAGDMVEIVDGALDLIYVVLGMLVSYGVNPWPIWQAVHHSNMMKADGIIDESGKKRKPPGWTPPDVAGCLEAQGWDGGQPR